MKYVFTFIATITLLAFSCSKENRKGCWQGYDGYLISTGVVCDKTKDEAKSMPYTVFVCPADEKKYCWVLSNNVHYSCIPQTIMEDFCRPQGLTFTKENCIGTCRYKRLDENGSSSTVTQYVRNDIFPRSVLSQELPITFTDDLIYFKKNKQTENQL